MNKSIINYNTQRRFFMAAPPEVVVAMGGNPDQVYPRQIGGTEHIHIRQVFDIVDNLVLVHPWIFSPRYLLVELMINS